MTSTGEERDGSRILTAQHLNDPPEADALVRPSVSASVGRASGLIGEGTDGMRRARPGVAMEAAIVPYS